MKRREMTSLAVLLTVVCVLPAIWAQEGGWNPRGRYLFKDELAATSEKFKQQHGYWVSRTAAPTPDRVFVTLERPIIESNGAVGMSRTDRIYYSSRIPWLLEGELTPYILLFGRAIERGQIAFVSDPKITFYERDLKVPAGDRIQLDGRRTGRARSSSGMQGTPN
jgi:hypothetical protein